MVGGGLFGVYVAYALVWRAVVHRRRAGDSGNRVFETTAVGRVASLVIVVGHVVTLVAVLGGDGPVAAVVVGAVVVLAALGFVGWAQRSMGDSWRMGTDPDERTELVTSGPFARVRNPIFTGMVVVLLGLAVVTWSWPAVVGAVLLAVGVELQVRGVEEPYLRRTHGTGYDDYLGRTGRFVPRLHATI
jgi:protein-S-isoprenylcysteine O-methyltransferase Ste14